MLLLCSSNMTILLILQVMILFIIGVGLLGSYLADVSIKNMRNGFELTTPVYFDIKFSPKTGDITKSKYQDDLTNGTITPANVKNPPYPLLFLASNQSLLDELLKEVRETYSELNNNKKVAAKKEGFYGRFTYNYSSFFGKSHVEADKTATLHFQFVDDIPVLLELTPEIAIDRKNKLKKLWKEKI